MIRGPGGGVGPKSVGAAQLVDPGTGKVWGSDGAGNAAAVSQIAGAATLLAQSGVAVSHTGDTTETVMATIPVPANTLGKNGFVSVRLKYAKVGTAGSVAHRAYLGLSGAGLTGAKLFEFGGQVAASIATDTLLGFANTNSTGAQVGNAQAIAGLGNNATTAMPTSAIDTTLATEIAISIQLASALDSISLVFYQALAYPSA